MTEYIVVLNTCASAEEAERLARTLVDRRLAACVSVAPGVRSFYRWQGAVESANEWLLIIKSSRDLFPALSAAITTAHSYEIPEIVALPIVEGAADYLNWLGSGVRAEEQA